MDQKDTLTSEAVCPFLGLRYDRDTRYGFPNEGNHCHRERSPRTINLDYQEGVCLTSGYLNCPIYLHSGGGVPVGHANSNVKVIPRGQAVDAAETRRPAPVARTSNSDATPWTMLDEVDEHPPARSAGGLFSYGWFRLLFGLLLVVGSLSGMLLLIQQTDLGGPGSGSGIATATPAGGVLPLVGTNTPETPTETLLPSPTHTAVPSGTPQPSATISPTATGTPTATSTDTPTPSPTTTSPPFNPPTNTPIPSWTPSRTPTPPLPTSTPVPTNTPIPTSTPVPPTNTPAPPTLTPIPPTETPISDLPTPTP
jgi:hypothetical protein